MIEEASRWLKQALRDLEAGQRNFEIGEYYLVAFLAQQAVEKALKALYIHKFRESTQTHSLVFLGKAVGIPDEFLGILRDLTPDFVISRYPDVAGEVPYEIYDDGIARRKLENAKKVVEWVKRELQK